MWGHKPEPPPKKLRPIMHLIALAEEILLDLRYIRYELVALRESQQRVDAVAEKLDKLQGELNRFRPTPTGKL